MRRPAVLALTLTAALLTACAGGSSGNRSITDSDPEDLRACRSTVSQDSATPEVGCNIER
ncbi:MAG: hypothetical protein Kilf2KO_26920 [Rhodospirillales bacterium]